MKLLRRILLVVTIMVAAIGQLVLAGVPVYVLPLQAPPRESDVILVMGPPEDWRFDHAVELVDAGIADTVMVSVWSDHVAVLCREPQDFEVICDDPRPFTTQGEARWLRDTMLEQGWDRATVITSAPHLNRARLYLGRCVGDHADVVSAPAGYSLSEWAYQYVYQTLGFVRAALQTRGC